MTILDDVFLALDATPKRICALAEQKLNQDCTTLKAIAHVFDWIEQQHMQIFGTSIYQAMYYAERADCRTFRVTYRLIPPMFHGYIISVPQTIYF